MTTKSNRKNPSTNPGPTRKPEPARASEPAGYFDLHTRGCGYLNRIRWVTPKSGGRKAEKFLACAINALHGKIADPMYSYMDLRVSGEEAISLVSGLIDDSEADRKIFVAFTVGDIYAHTYWRDIKEHGRKTGEQEPAAVIKGRLLLITHIAVDDVVVYHLDRAEAVDDHAADVDSADPAGDEGNDGGIDEEPDPHDDAPPAEPAGRISQFPPRSNGVARHAVRDTQFNVGQPYRGSFRGRAEA